jgi:hypothetical protein
MDNCLAIESSLGVNECYEETLGVRRGFMGTFGKIGSLRVSGAQEAMVSSSPMM